MIRDDFFMGTPKQNKLRTVSLFLVAACTFNLGYAQDINDAKQICESLSLSDRSAAKAAGYDLDKVCDAFKASTKKTIQTVNPINLVTVPRKTISSAIPKIQSDVTAKVTQAKAIVVQPVKPLKPFGYDLFANAPSTFAPTNSIPVSADYLLGPGDMLEILFYGKTNNSFSIEVNRDGVVDFPELGPVGLAGLTFSEAKEMLQTRISEQVIGTKVSISLGKLRSMQIFVLGEAYKPGAYTVSSLSTITHALVSSGGVSDIATLRKIQLKRAGKVISTLDLYDLLISGDTSKDIRLQASDVIYIPTVGDLVSVDGEVLRPAIYELNGETTASDLVELAGGLGAKAFAKGASIERIDRDGFMTVVDVDLTQAAGKETLLHTGDHLHINGVIDRKESIVTLSGHVYHPGQFKWKPGMRLTDILDSIDKFPPNLDLDYALISRETKPIGNVEAIKIDLRSILLGNNPEADIELFERDTVHIFSVISERGSELENVITKIKSQARSAELAKVVTISGTVRLPGEYPLTQKMRVLDLILAAGDFSTRHTTYDYGVLVRTNFLRGDIEVLDLSLNELHANENAPENLTLLPRDEIVLFAEDEDRSERLAPTIARLKKQARADELSSIVFVSGAVKFPGEYPLVKGMDVTGLVLAAGGFKDATYTQSAELSRTNLSNPSLAKVNTIPFSIAGNEVVSDIQLQPLDRVSFRAIPEFRDTRKITLQGEFKFPGEYFFEQGELLGSVVQRAGGFTDYAHIDASFFTRTSLMDREQREIDQLNQQVTEEIAATRFMDSNSENSLDSEQIALQDKTLRELRAAKAVGRLVIPLREILAMRANDILLEDGDRILVPKYRQEVTIIGEVQRPISYLFNPGYSVADYLEQSGGALESADLDAIYIVKASGKVVLQKASLFRFFAPFEKVQPGDTIVVPLDTDKSKFEFIPLMAEVSKIIYQTALGVSALKSFQ
jgi:protein involved in polysaccharide export with SLBB domain